MILDHEIVNRFATNLKARGKQPSTVESYTRDAQRFLEYLERHRMTPKMVEPDTLVAFQTFLRDECEERDNSIRRTVIGIRQFFRFLSEDGAIPSTPFDSVAIPMRDESLPAALTENDIDALFAVAQSAMHPVKAARDCAIVALLAFEGLKAGELINLKWEDFLHAGAHASLRIGGNKPRAIQLSVEAASWLSEYRAKYDTMRDHPVLTRAEPEVGRRIFIAFKGRDAATPIPEMTRHGLKFILYELGEKAGLKHLNTEQLRHFAVSHLISLGRSSEEIMMHLGLKRVGNIAKHMSRSKDSRSKERALEGASRA